MSAVTDTVKGGGPVAGGGISGSVRDSLVVAKRNLIRMARIPEMILFGIIQPVMFVVLFTYVFGGSIAIPGAGVSADAYKEFLMAGIFAQTVTFATAGAGAGIADDMHKGLIDRFRSLPMARGAVLTGRTLADSVQTAITLLVLAIVALLVGWRTHENIGSVLFGFVLLLLLGYAFSWIGALIGLSVRTPEAATSGGLIWLFPLTFISNAFVPVNGMPSFLQHVAEWNPFSATVAAARQLFGNTIEGVPKSVTGAWPMEHPIWASIIWSVLIILVSRTLAVRKYRNASACPPWRARRSPRPQRPGASSCARGRTAHPWCGLTSRIFTVAILPLGSSYCASSPSFLPFTPEPSGDCGEYVSMSSEMYSREASRNVMVSSSSPSKAIVTTMPGPTTPLSAGGSPTFARSRSCVSWRTRSSCLPWSSRAA